MRHSHISRGRRGFHNPFAGLFAGPLFVVVGAVMAFFGWRDYSTTKTFLAGAEHANGSVVELVARTSTDSEGDASILYYPVVEFTTDPKDLSDYRATLAATIIEGQGIAAATGGQ